MIFKFLTNLFKTKEEPIFSASIQRVPSTQVSLDTSKFEYINVYEGFESLDTTFRNIEISGPEGPQDPAADITVWNIEEACLNNSWAIDKRFMGIF